MVSKTVELSNISSKYNFIVPPPLFVVLLVSTFHMWEPLIYMMCCIICTHSLPFYLDSFAPLWSTFVTLKEWARFLHLSHWFDTLISAVFLLISFSFSQLFSKQAAAVIRSSVLNNRLRKSFKNFVKKMFYFQILFIPWPLQVLHQTLHNQTLIWP